MSKPPKGLPAPVRRTKPPDISEHLAKTNAMLDTVITGMREDLASRDIARVVAGTNAQFTQLPKEHLALLLTAALIRLAEADRG